MPYRERVPAAGWFRWFIRLAALGPVAIVLVASFVAMDGGTGERIAAAVTAVLTGAVVLAIDQWFMVLLVTADHDGLEARFGPFHTRLDARDLFSATDAPYRWTQYGGWGIRGLGKRRAWSVPFLRTGVEFVMHDGRHVYVSSRTPRALVEAVGREPRQ